MSTLLVIEKQFKELYQAYNEVESEEDRQNILQQLYEIESDRGVKFENCCKWREELLGDEAKAEFLYLKAQTNYRLAVKRREDFEKYMEMCIPIGETFDDGAYSFKWVRNPPSVDVFDEELLPDQYKRAKFEMIPDKKSLLPVLKELKKQGREHEIPGAALVDDKFRLVFK